MEDAFDSYIKQLQQLEQSENRASLYSFCSLNEPVLSYFKSIWGPLQSILQSSQVDTGIIDEVKPILAILSEIRDIYESLKSNPAKSCLDEIIHFQKQIDTLTVSTCSGVLLKLQEIDTKNRLALKTARSPKSPTSTSSWANEKDRILRGEISSAADITLAEEHIAEGTSLLFFKSLASKTRKASVLNNVYVYAKKELSAGQWVDMLWALVRTRVSFDKKEDAVLDLLYRTDDPNSLSELEHYCNTDRTRSVYKSKSKKSKGGSGAGWVFLVLVIIAIAVFFTMFV